MYDVFAAYYDRLTENVDYAARANYFDGLIRENMTVKDGAILLDLGCGTGSLTVELAARGYDMIGADGSGAMLCAAMGKGGERIQYIRQDFTALDLYGTVDGVVCALDSLNHITDEETLDETFRRVALFTAPGGLFLFDVNTPYKHRCVLADNAFVYDLGDVFCVWQNFTNHEPLCTDISLDFFIRRGNHYVREQECFRERPWEDRLLRSLLPKHGYELLAVYAGDTRRPLGETDQRAVYVARRLGESAACTDQK